MTSHDLTLHHHLGDADHLGAGEGLMQICLQAGGDSLVTQICYCRWLLCNALQAHAMLLVC